MKRFSSLLALLVICVSAFADVDKTALVPTSWGGAPTAGSWAAPFVTTADGRKDVAMSENYDGGSGDKTGVIISQKVEGLENGSYTLVLYANALYTVNRGIARTNEFEDGATDVAYVFANDVQVPVAAINAETTATNGEYTIEVEVTDGTIEMGIAKSQSGTNWHTIQIKSLVLKTGLTNIIPNGNLEGEDAAGFVIKSNTGDAADQLVSTITAGAGVNGTNGAEVVSKAGASQDWDAQFWIVLPEALPEGKEITVMFDYKATAPVAIDTQAHANPGEYNHWNCVGTVNFTTDWQTYKKTITIDAAMAKGNDGNGSAEGMKSIAFNLSKDKANDITFYFDNIVVEMEKEVELDYTVTPAFVTEGEEGEEEYTLNDHSAVTVPGAKAIKVGFADAAASIKYATYVVNELVEDEFMGVVDVIEQEVASGTLSINAIGYAEFENPVKFYYGHKYNVSIKAWNVDADNLFDENFNMVAPIATFTCEFNGSTDENPAVVLGQPNFGDRVVEGMEIAAADWQGLTLSFPENNLETAYAEAIEQGALNISGTAKLYTMDKEEPLTEFFSGSEPEFGKIFARTNLVPGKTYHFEIEAGALKVEDMREMNMETWEGKLLYTNEEPITFNFYVLPELEAGKPEIAIVDEKVVVSFPEGNFAEACGSKYENGDIKFAALVRYYDAEGNEVAVDIVGAHESEFAIPTKNAAFVPELEYTAVIPAGKLIVTDFADFDFDAWKNGAEVGPQLYVSTEDLVCKFIAPDDKEYVIENVDLAADMFKSWSAADATGEATGAAGCAFEIGTSTGMPYGDGNVYYLNYADLSQYDKIVAVATEGEPRFLFNRTEDNGAVGVELPRDKETYETVVENADGSKTYTVDIKKIVAKDGFAHLHAIKGANWANTTVTEIYLVKKTEKIDTTVTLSLIADNDNEYTVNDHSIVTIDAPIKAIKATFGDLNPMEEVKYAIYDKRTALAEGTMSVNTIGYAEFEAPVTFYEGIQYYIALTIGEELREYYVIGAVELPVIANGNYYIINKESGAFLTGDNSWGTQASVGKNGVEFTVALEDGKYSILNTALSCAKKYLGTNLYVDADNAGWTIEEAGEGVYTISNEAGYLAQSATLGANNLPIIEQVAEVSDAALWSFTTKDELIAQLEGATEETDVTFLVSNPGFNRNHVQTAWVVGEETTNKNLGGGANENFCGESWRSAFTISQTIEGLPNGTYVVMAQASATEYEQTGEELPVVFANDATSTFVISTVSGTMEAGENSMTMMSASFKEGLYPVAPITVNVTDGTLTIGVKGTRVDTWCIWDNFQVIYKPVAPAVKNEIATAATALDGMSVVITDAAGQNTLTACHTVHPAGEQDAFTLALSEYTGEQYIYAKFAKVTDASVSGDNLYTIQMCNAAGQFYSLWGANGYLNFQPAGQNIVFVLGLTDKYGQDAENCGLWEVNAVDGGYTVKNVGNGGYYNPCEAVPSAEPVVVKFWESAVADDAVSAPGATGINNVIASKPAGIYSVTGAKVAGLQKGINIVVDENGATKKVILK